MDLTRRAMLNDFGLVQHAVFESADHNAVHVIYRHTQKPFVHITLTKELKTRTGLQLVPPQSRVATSSSKGDGVVIVIVDSQDSPTYGLLYRTDSLTDMLLYRLESLTYHCGQCRPELGPLHNRLRIQHQSRAGTFDINPVRMILPLL